MKNIRGHKRVGVSVDLYFSSCTYVHNFTGYFKDVTGNWNVSFVVAGSILIFGGCLTVLEHKFMTKTLKDSQFQVDIVEGKHKANQHDNHFDEERTFLTNDKEKYSEKEFDRD